MSSERKDPYSESPTFKLTEKKEEPENVPEFGTQVTASSETETLPTFGFLQNFMNKPLFSVTPEEKQKPKKAPAKKTIVITQLPVDELNMSANSANVAADSDRHETKSANVNLFGSTSPLSNLNRSFDSVKNESPETDQKSYGFSSVSSEKRKEDVSITLKFAPGLEPVGTNNSKTPSLHSDSVKESTGKKQTDSLNTSGVSLQKSPSIDVKEPEKPKILIGKGLVINKGLSLPVKGAPEKPALKLPPPKNQKMADELDLAEILGNTLNKK